MSVSAGLCDQRATAPTPGSAPEIVTSETQQRLQMPKAQVLREPSDAGLAEPGSPRSLPHKGGTDERHPLRPHKSTSPARPPNPNDEHGGRRHPRHQSADLDPAAGRCSPLIIMESSQTLSPCQPTNRKQNERAADLNGNPNPNNDESPSKDASHRQQEETNNFSWTDVVSTRARRQQLHFEKEKAAAVGERVIPASPTAFVFVVIRPRDGLNLGAWSTDKLTRAILVATKLSSTETADITIRIRRDQNLAVISTPSLETSSRIEPISALTLKTRQYEVTAYLAVADNSCRGIISGVDTRPTAETLTEELRAPKTNILYVRMMGQTKTAIITIEGLKVPHYVYLSGGEYPCRPSKKTNMRCLPRPRTSHRRVTATREEGAMEDRQCKPHCVNCGGEHPAVDPRCPARQRGPY
ncbi:hypothetical protein HPB47_026204 [Ixodes persulcatus]|uniref:Uncharacterized protein n=1 Tax=Ixodes persulcatus TaxID=34615 RepID=A0AC60PZF6_IXOPE|nr:hypothetical protein HPB47_026204 [Ixodes persulcatus]